VSCPTIRNEMADLTDQGYLVQPHTSAGRIPSERGYRFFVDYFIKGRVARPARKGNKRNVNLKDAAQEVSLRTRDLVIFVDEDGEVKYTGLKRVLKNPEFETRSAMLSMIEELERFQNHSDMLMMGMDEEIEILIGSENSFFEDQKYSMILSGLSVGSIAIMGPMRMNYQKNIELLIGL